MPRRALPVGVFSSSPYRLRCLAVLTAAWGSESFRSPPFAHRHLVSTQTCNSVASPAVGISSGSGRTGVGGCAVLRRDAEQKCAQKTLTADSAAADPGEVAAAAAEAATITSTAAFEVGKRPWLGNGPDPMVQTGKIRPGTSESLAAEGGGVLLGNGPDPLRPSEEAVAATDVGGDEMWLNGPFKAQCQGAPLDILYCDEDIVVANKPSNLLCVPGRVEKDSLATRVALELGHYRVDKMIVHRLDMATSGCVIMARTDAALKDLNRQFRERQVRKRYVAMVQGVLWADEGEVDLPVCRNRGCPPLHMVNVEHGKPSLTQWRVLDRAADRTRVELIPVSGRSHQLRLHMDAIGHPILGDHFYGNKVSLALADRCLLHAHTLCLRHPVSGKEKMFTAPCDF